MRHPWKTVAVARCASLSLSAHGDDQLVEKKTLTIPTSTTVGGQTIKNVKLGCETTT